MKLTDQHLAFIQAALQARGIAVETPQALLEPLATCPDWVEWMVLDFPTPDLADDSLSTADTQDLLHNICQWTIGSDWLTHDDSVEQAQAKVQALSDALNTRDGWSCDAALLRPQLHDNQLMACQAELVKRRILPPNLAAVRALIESVPMYADQIALTYHTDKPGTGLDTYDRHFLVDLVAVTFAKWKEWPDLLFNPEYARFQLDLMAGLRTAGWDWDTQEAS